MPQALLALFLAAAISGTKPPQEAGEWLARTHKKLTTSDTAQWEATFEVLEAPPAKEQGRVFPFHVGTMRYRFRVKGEGRLHWAEKWEGKGKVPTREAWYEGNILHVRSTRDPKKLVPIEVGEGEGYCVERSLVEGGILGWRLAHGFDRQDAGGGYVAAMKIESGGEEKIKGVTAIVLNVKIGFGFGPERARGEVGTTRLWIDKKKFLFIKRETTLNLGGDNKPVKIRVKEGYTNWKLNEPIANKSFHVKGMGPPYALVDAPKGPAAFEKAQTTKFLGFAVRDFPHPQGPKKFDQLPADAAAFVFTLAPRKVSGPEPKESYEPRKSVFAKAPDGSTIEAYVGGDDDEGIARGHGFKSTPENRRHGYGGGAYYPQDVFIGKRIEGRLKPALFFRDVGSHTTAPHTLAVDGKGRCHLMLADVDLGQNNRFKLYWLVGNLATRKWTEAWLVDHRDRFTSWAHPWSAAWKEHVHVIWNWDGGEHAAKGGEPGVYHVEWTPAGFGRKTCISNGNAEYVDVAIDPLSGRLVLVFSTDDGVFVASKPNDGVWTRPTPLHDDLTKQERVLIQAVAKGKFAIRTHHHMTREWLLTIGKAKDKAQNEKLPVRTDRLGDPLPDGAITRLGSLRLTHPWGCRCVTFSPDGKILASGSDEGEIGLWAMPGGRPIHRLSGHAWQTNALAFSPGGKQLASVGNDKSARVWHVLTGKQLLRLRHDGHVVAVAYSPDGKTLATASEDKTIRFWNPATGKQIRKITTRDEKFAALAFAPNGRVLASGSWEVPTICLWEVARGDKPRRVPGHKGGVRSLTFSRDGKLLISDGWDGMIQVSDLVRGAKIRRFGGGIQGTVEGRILVTAMALSPDGKVVAAGGHDHIDLWNPAAGKRLRRLGPTGLIHALAFSPDGKYLAAADRKKARLWDLSKGEELRVGKGHVNWLNTLAFSPDGKAIATGGDDGMVILWDAATGAPLRRLPHKQEITQVSFSPDGRLLATACREKTVRLWSTRTGSVKKQLGGHPGSVYELAFSPDGKILAVASGRGRIHLWDMAAQKEVRRLTGHENWISSLIFSKTGKELISGSVDNTVRLWNVATGTEIRQFDILKKMVNSLALSPDGTTVAIGYFQSKTIHLWDPATGKVIRAIEGPKDGAVSLTFARDGKLLAVANPQGDEVRLLDVATGKEINRLCGHLERVFSIAISPNGRKLATGSGDGTALVWDLGRVGKQ
jgi:WD40 repeat protein